jgi:uncharacterized membrane protein
MRILMELNKDVSSAQILWWAMALILLVLVMGVVILLVRQRTARNRKQLDTPEVVYSLRDLRKMLNRGEITREEFEKLKEIVNTQTRKIGPLSREEDEDRSGR